MSLHKNSFVGGVDINFEMPLYFDETLFHLVDSSLNCLKSALCSCILKTYPFLDLFVRKKVVVSPKHF